jgi:hypothetical protein
LKLFAFFGVEKVVPTLQICNDCLTNFRNVLRAPKLGERSVEARGKTVEAGIELNSRDVHLLPIGKGYIAKFLGDCNSGLVSRSDRRINFPPFETTHNN